MKKAGILFLLFLWVIGAIGGTCYAVYYKVGLPIILGMVVAVLFGLPTAKRLWDNLNQ